MLLTLSLQPCLTLTSQKTVVLLWNEQKRLSFGWNSSRIFSSCTYICFVRFSDILVHFIVVRKGCHLNPIWRTFSLGGPSEFIGFIFNPLKSIILIFKGVLSNNAYHFSSWFVRHTWSHSYSVTSVWVEKEWRPKQTTRMPIYFQILQWRTVKLMTLLHFAYITFLGNFFNQVYFPFDYDSSAQKFSFQHCLCI